MMSTKNGFLAIALLASILGSSAQNDAPNLVIVYTDEHNFRTIGAYRELLSKEHSELWGDGVVVDTPNLDRLAHEGSLFTSFYTVAPLCTPSRASFMTGLYPKATGAWLNHNAMDPDMKTWAHILKQKKGYHTGYVGKWHLNGNEKPGWNSGKKFGFTENKWQYNRGHWKFFDDDPVNGPTAYEWTEESEAKFKDTMDKNFATDFLMDRGIEVIDNALKQDLPFAVMISIPDPHSPNIVRPPYNTMYDHFQYKVPFTGKVALEKNPALPGWSSMTVDIEDSDEVISELENNDVRHHYYSQIYGMVKLIDDNVGKLLDHLEAKGVDKNTIVVFTSDHGDQLGEHAKQNKGRPYETSAGVPMILRWPNGVQKGKVINTAYSSIDFAPTILSMLGVQFPGVTMHGIDASEEIMAPNTDKNANSKTQTRFITDSAKSKWATAVRDDYKLTLSPSEPWLFDLKADPHEIYNVYGNSSYASIIEDMQGELYDTMFQHKFPLLSDEPVSFFNQPACWDSRNQISDWKKRVCAELTDPHFSPGCQWRKIYEQCPVACKRCCEDSTGNILINGQLKTCDTVADSCSNAKVRNFCPMTCDACASGFGREDEDDNGEEADDDERFLL